MEKKTNTEFPMGATLQGNSQNYEGATLSYDEAQKGSFNIMEKKQTAVDYLVEQLIKQGFFKRLPIIEIQQASQMEKEQLEHSYFVGSADRMNDEGSFEQYYNETYGGQDIKTTFTRAPKMIIPNSNGTTKTLTDLKIDGTI